jgi:hypothetical protein
MKFFTRSAAFVLGFFLIAGAAFSQVKQMQQQQAQPDSVTDEQLKKFAAVNQELQKIRQSSSQKVQSMLADKEMNMQRFQQIMMSQQNPQAPDSLAPTQQEQETMKEIQPKLNKIQKNSRSQMMGAMKENGLNQQQFQTILRAIQSNPAVMKRFQKISQGAAQN